MSIAPKLRNFKSFYPASTAAILATIRLAASVQISGLYTLCNARNSLNSWTNKSQKTSKYKKKCTYNP